MMKKLLLFVLLALPAPALAQNTYDSDGRLLGNITINDGSVAGAADVINSAPGGTEYGLVCRNIPSGTQGVSGTVTANQGTAAATAGRWPVQLTDGTDLALVTAAGEIQALCTAQPGVDIGDVTINNAAGASAVNVQDGGNSLTVDAPVGTPVAVRPSDGSAFITPFNLDLDGGAGTADRQAVGLAIPDLGGPSSVGGDAATHSLNVNLAQFSSGTAVNTNPNGPVAAASNDGACVALGTSTTVLLASNAARRGFVLTAPTTNTITVFVRFAATATTSDFPMEPGSAFNMLGPVVYTGAIDGIKTGLPAQSICLVEF